MQISHRSAGPSDLSISVFFLSLLIGFAIALTCATQTEIINMVAQAVAGCVIIGLGFCVMVVSAFGL